ncbi:Transcriptional response regulatory protein GlrR [hydrothermal vent metagenome]|uniref:Transcriptional response regulatory protein GlrR n=1 Tax=hydrothermal vent metagenome TaxID=652676 RepID=A0A3B0ZBR0_9ZZZZ
MTTNRATILIVDDDKDLLQLLSFRLTTVGYDVTAVDSAEKALDQLTISRPHLVITDFRMGGMNGIQLLEIIQRDNPSLPVIILTAHGSIPDAINATHKGVFGFLTKPFDSKDLLSQVEKAVGLGAGSTLETSSSFVGSSDDTWCQEIITRSSLMEDLIQQAWLVAQSDASVFIRGDSGTGKELFAQAIHRASPRKDKSFVTINCAAIPEQLLESELFGYNKGAFTGATRNHKGLIQEANGGTLFLDEIGDMPVILQAKLLRVIQERVIRVLGSTQDIPVDIRLVSATHRDINEEIRSGSFREDLYYRLNVVSLEIPPLSERREDITLIVNMFLGELSSKYEKPLKTFSPAALELLLLAPLPGNVRQLRNIVEQAFTLCSTQVIPASLVKGALREVPMDMPSLKDAKARFERDYILKILKITAGNVSQAARLAKRNRTEFYKLLHRHQVDPGVFKIPKNEAAESTTTAR